MDYIKDFNAICDEGFSKEVSLLTMLLLQQNLLKPVEDRHITSGVFTEELLTSFRDSMWRSPSETVDEAIKIWEVLHVYNCCQEMDGVGGCTKKTIRELMKD